MMSHDTGVGDGHPLSSSKEFELPPSDKHDLFRGMLHMSEALKEHAEPTIHEKTAYSIDLLKTPVASKLHGRVWSRYNNLSMDYRCENTIPVMALTFNSPQKYDSSQLTFQPDQDIWSLTIHNQSRPIQVLRHDELLLVLREKLAYKNQIVKLADAAPKLSSKAIVMGIADVLMPLAHSTTDSTVYEVKKVVESDAFLAQLVTKLTIDEGASLGVDYRIQQETRGIKLAPPKPNDSVNLYITSKYDHCVTVPYENGVPEFVETSYSAQTYSPEGQKYQTVLDGLVLNEDPSESAGDTLRKALQIVSRHFLA